jgi:hypothetical protein
MTPAPYLVRLVKQDGISPDCAVASLAMLCGVTYGEALAAFPKPQRVMQVGAYLTEMAGAAKRLNVKTELKRTFELDEDTGILHVSSRKDEHVVFLWAGRIIEGNGECWLHPGSYMKAHKYKPKSLLSLVE